MKKLLLLFVLLVNLSYGSTADKYRKELEALNFNQKVDMMFAYAMGLPEDLGLTLAAIAWKESNFNKYPMNVTDGKYGSYSMFHILLDYAAVRHGANTKFQKNKLAQRLLNDKKFAAREAISVLKAFEKDGCGWRCQVASYNGGTRGLNNPKGAAYAADIAIRIKVLDQYFTKNNLYVKIGTIVYEETGFLASN